MRTTGRSEHRAGSFRSAEDANREQIVADFDDAGHGQGKPFNRSAYRIRFDATFQGYDAFVGMHINAVGIDLFALNEPLGNRRFQLIAIDAIRWQRSGGMSRVFFEPGRVGCICDKPELGSSSKFAGVVPYPRFFGSVEPNPLSSEYGQPSRLLRS